MSRYSNYDFDRYDDFDDERVSVSDCYCKLMMLCSYCAKGYN
jgi:hypothetical protein